MKPSSRPKGEQGFLDKNTERKHLHEADEQFRQKCLCLGVNIFAQQKNRTRLCVTLERDV